MLAAGGRFVTFESLANTLVPGFSGHNGYVHELPISYAPPPPAPPPPPPPPPPAMDTVSIQLAEYDTGGRRLRVEATSTSSSATLTVYVTSTNTFIGILSNDGGGRYRGEFTWASNPGSITVKSSLGGSATRSVVVK